MTRRSRQMQILADLSRPSNERYPSSQYRSVNPDSGLQNTPQLQDDSNPVRRFMRRLGLSLHDRYIEDVQHHEEADRFTHHQKAATQTAKQEVDHRQFVFDERQALRSRNVAASTGLATFVKSARMMRLLTQRIDEWLTEKKASTGNPDLYVTFEREFKAMHQKIMAKYRHNAVGPDIDPYEFEDEEFFG
ncbi:hypothetical protein [Rhodopirellula sp. MGV]|uniref:hypothetical protein n=1 Tax=Rhodopirellula sp. MGV TaxID=2023130 RepID=UPI00117B50DC|nr:hypothetical protein [Rhodopirellula sp. MGV]